MIKLAWTRPATWSSMPPAVDDALRLLRKALDDPLLRKSMSLPSRPCAGYRNHLASMTWHVTRPGFAKTRSTSRR